MDQVIVFDKSLQERLQEYTDVLAGYETLPAATIKREWSFYLELTVDVNGWQAVWKMQRKTCEAFNIPFPSVVLVLVLEVDFKELSALVRVLAVQDDIHLPEKHHVPLMQLFPTKDQDRSVVINILSTANALDMLRFFYNYLFMPWDLDDDETLDWKNKHLERRLRLYYDMKNGVIPQAAAEHLHAIMTEAKRLQVKKESLESLLEDLEIEENPLVYKDDKIQALAELHIRLMEIKAEVDIFENPLFRKTIIIKHQQMVLNENNTHQNIWLVYKQGTPKEAIEFLNKIDQNYSGEKLKFSPSLITTLECANPNDVVLLSETSHEIKRAGALEGGGTLRGISERKNTVLISDIEDVMLDFRGDLVVLQNITIKATTPQCAIIVRKGQLTLKNCDLVGDGKSSTHQGIIVLAGGKLEINDCDISNFYTAIVGNSGSIISLDNTEIHDCNIGLKVYDNCVMRASESIIRNCKEYGICVETENNLNENESKVGDFDTLNIIPKLQMDSITGYSNMKGDAIVNHKKLLKPVEDLFENTETDPTVCEEFDEEMDTQINTTVTENYGRISPATI